jgi:hypothetical protein
MDPSIANSKGNPSPMPISTSDMIGIAIVAVVVLPTLAAAA